MTAVEWLLNRIEDVDNTPKIWEQIKLQAKEMEKQQILDAFDEGQEYEYQYHINNTPKFDSKTYYAETYGSKGSDETKNNNMTQINLLEEELQKLEVKYISMILEYRKEKRLIFEKYKEIHKQQIIDAYIVGDSESSVQQSINYALSYYERTYGSKGSDETKPYWIGVVKWNDGTILTTKPFYQYQNIKVWSSKFSYENTGKFESIDYKRIDGSKDFTYTEAQKNEERVNNAKIVKDAISSQTEISDEEIEKGAKEWYEKKGLLRPYQIEKMAWISAIKWYREQLKQRQ